MAQRPTNLTRWVVADTEAPGLTISQPAELAPDTWAHSSIVVVKETETDDYRPGPVFYRIEKALSAANSQFKDSPAEYLASGWKDLTVRGTEWSDSVNFQEGAAPLGERIFYLYVAAFDEAGHQAPGPLVMPQ